MNSALKKSPNEETATGPGSSLFLTLRIPALPEFGPMLPQSNFIGTTILAKLLDAKLEEACQASEAAGFTGPLNCAVLVFTVRQAHESARIIAANLAKLHLIACAKIYRWDAGELILRHLFPANGQDIKKEELDAICETCAEQTNAAINQILKLLPPPGPQP